MAALAAARLSKSEYCRARRLLILGYLALATLPGIPTVFYGDEVGLEGYRDPLNRRPYPWHRQDRVLFSAYREIGALRRGEPVYRQGEFSLVALTAQLLIFFRTDGKRLLLTAINRGDTGVYLQFSEPVIARFGGAGKRCRHSVYPLCGAVLEVPLGCRLSVLTDRGTHVFLRM